MSGALPKRVFVHQNKLVEGFTSRYDVNRLVYYEVYNRAIEAIAREKQLKKWSRPKKNFLIETPNPEWKDLSEEY